MALSNELKLLRNAPLSFMKAYGVSPGSGYRVKQEGKLAYVPLARVFHGQIPNADSLLTMTTHRDKIAYADLTRSAGDKYELNLYSHHQLHDAQTADSFARER